MTSRPRILARFVPNPVQLLVNRVPGASRLTLDRLHPLFITEGGARELAAHTTSDLTLPELTCLLPAGLELRLRSVVLSTGCARPSAGRSPTSHFLQAPRQVLAMSSLSLFLYTRPKSRCTQQIE